LNSAPRTAAGSLPAAVFYACWRGFLLGQLTFENSLVQPLNLGIKKGQELNPSLFIERFPSD